MPVSGHEGHSIEIFQKYDIPSKGNATCNIQFESDNRSISFYTITYWELLIFADDT